MVYESDFYTSRRPYTRPTVSSYSVTSPSIRFIPGFGRVETYTTSYPVRSIPYIGHKRLVTGTRIITSPTRILSSPIRVMTSPGRVYTSPIRIIRQSSPITTRYLRASPVRDYSPERDYESPVRVIRVRPSILNREFDRIEHKNRQHFAYRPTDDYLSSPSYINFDDETRDIRTSISALSKRIQSSYPRAHSPVYYSSRYGYNTPSRWGGDDSYISSVLGPLKSVRDDVSRISNYAEPAKRFVGKSHLASIRIVGDKAYDKRTPRYADEMKVRKDVNFLSYYLKNRQAAAQKTNTMPIMESAKLDPARATRKFTAPVMLEDPTLELKELKAARLDKFNSAITDSTIVKNVTHELGLERKKKQRMEEEKLFEEKVALEEKAKKAEKAKRDEEARLAELERQEKLAALAAAERAAEIERKAEEAKQEAAKVEAARLAEEATKAEAARLAEEAAKAEEARLAEEAAKAEAARLVEEAAKAEAARLAEEAKKAEEAKLAEELRLAEEARIAEEKKIRDDEMARLAELEKLADEEREAELARQAAELAEIARQEAEIAERAAGAVACEPTELVAEPVIDEPQTPEATPVIESTDLEVADEEEEEEEEEE